MIEGPALVLNKSFTPIHITSIKRAVCLVFKGLAHIVDEQYQVYDFESWSDLRVYLNQEKIQMTQKAIRVPRVIMLNFYDKLPKRHVRLTRENIYRRDQNRCQYCGKKFSRADLNLDHVIPVSQGGITSWENVVCSCVPCNQRKGGHTPDQAHMPLLKKAIRPHHSIFMNVSPKKHLFDAWRIYMNPKDYAYWCLELKQ